MLWHETDCAIIALPFFVARQVQEQLFPNCFVAPLSCMATVRQSPLFRAIVFLPRFFYFVRPPAFSSAIVSSDFAAFRIFASSFNLGSSDGPEYCLAVEGSRSQIDCSKFGGPKAEGERKVHKVQTQALGPSKKRCGTLLSVTEMGVKCHVPDGMMGYD